MTTRTRKSKTFEPGHGYTKEEWDAVDFPELTDEELTNMRPARDVLPPEFFKAMEEHRRSRGRPRWSIRKASHPPVGRRRDR